MKDITLALEMDQLLANHTRPDLSFVIPALNGVVAKFTREA
jgi:hypothetical protein